MSISLILRAGGRPGIPEHSAFLPEQIGGHDSRGRREKVSGPLNTRRVAAAALAAVAGGGGG